MVTDFLFVKPSSIKGAGSVIDFFGEIPYNSSESEKEADERAIYSDWSMIGQDISGAIVSYERR